MINFKKLLHDETAVVGLSSLGLSRKKTTNTTQTIKLNHQQQTEALFSAKPERKPSAFQTTSAIKSNDELESIFAKNLTLNLNKTKIIG